MKALVYTSAQQLKYQEMPEPDQRDGEVIVDVHSCGICGSDMHAYLGHDERRPAPLILGHEVAGTIQGTGAAVAVNPLITCGDCTYCQQGKDNLCENRQIISMPPYQGGFAEKITIPETNLVSVPEHFPLHYAALTEPLACGWHAVRLALKACRFTSPLNALVIGGGAIGVGSALSLQLNGIDHVSIVEPNEARRAHLNKSIPSLHILDNDHPDLVNRQWHIVIDAVGLAQTRENACKWVQPGGVIMHIGLGQSHDGLDIRHMTLQEITFMGTYTYTSQDFKEVADALFQGKFGSLDWVEMRNLDEGAVAFSDLLNGRVAAAKILLTI